MISRKIALGSLWKCWQAMPISRQNRAAGRAHRRYEDWSRRLVERLVAADYCASKAEKRGWNSGRRKNINFFLPWRINSGYQWWGAGSLSPSHTYSSYCLSISNMRNNLILGKFIPKEAHDWLFFVNQKRGRASVSSNGSPFLSTLEGPVIPFISTLKLNN